MREIRISKWSNFVKAMSFTLFGRKFWGADNKLLVSQISGNKNDLRSCCRSHTFSKKSSPRRSFVLCSINCHFYIFNVPLGYYPPYPIGDETESNIVQN